MKRRLALCLAAGLPTLACHAPAALPEPGRVEARPGPARRAFGGAGGTWSPQRDAEAHALADLCSRSDAALTRVAGATARRMRAEKAAPDPADVALALRFEGSPYVWPRVWVLSGPKHEGAEVRARMQRWLASFRGAGERRCGVASVSVDADSELVVAVAVDAVADLAPVPRILPVSSWVEIDARLLVPSSDAKVIVLGPRGAPNPVPTSFDGERVRARFNADQPGEWWVQVLASPNGGPRPVLEGVLHVGVVSARLESPAAPGEDAARANDDPRTALARMIASTRAVHGLPPLASDAGLDAVAQAHAEHMRSEGRVAHDLGTGDPAARVEALGRPVTRVGENVARAEGIVRAHRSLYRSPSHRANLLDRNFDAIGIGVASDANGVVWACELFARFER